MDFKFALRRLARSPGFFAAASVSLALGIGSYTAAFSVVSTVLLRRLPVKDPGALAVVSTRGTAFQYSMSYPAYTYLRDQAPGLDGVIAFRAQVLNVTAGGRTDRLPGMLVSGNYFDVLGVRLAMGSPIEPADDVVPGSGGRRGMVGLVPVFNVRTVRDQIDLAYGSEQTFATLSTTFGVLALILSALGLFGVMANAVSRRTKELGIRLTLGADPQRILRSVLGEAGLLVGYGALIGLPLAFLAARTARGLFFGVGPGDGRSIGAAMGVIVIVTVIAAWVPARRASRVDPLIALRSD